MIAQQAPALEVRYHRLEVTNRWLIGVGVVLLLALVALGTYVGVDRLSVSANERTVEAVQAALAGDDFEELQSYYSTEMIGLGPETGTIGGYDQMEEGFRIFHQYGTQVEGTGEAVAYGDFVLYPFTWSNNLGYHGTGVNLYQFDADGKIVVDFTLMGDLGD